MTFTWSFSPLGFSSISVFFMQTDTFFSNHTFKSFTFLSHALFQSLLDEPNPNSPANNLAAKLYQENRREYEKKVKVVVEESWVYLGETPSD